MNSDLWEPMASPQQFSPIGLARLDVSPPPLIECGEGSFIPEEQVNWYQVHQLVQRIFSEMAARIKDEWPMIRSRPGKSSARSFFLYTFMIFDLGDEEELDPVIVGLTFEPAPSGDHILVTGDICGEETGRIDFELDRSSVRNSHGDILPIALEMATKLGEQIDLTAKSVLDRHPPPIY